MAIKSLFKLYSSEVIVTFLGLVFGVFVARAFGLEAKGLLAGLGALIALGAVLSSLGVSYSAVKLGGYNTNRLLIIFSLIASLISLLFLFFYDYFKPTQINIINSSVELYLILFFTIYNLQSLAFILSRPNNKYYPMAIIFGQLCAFIVLFLMFITKEFQATWIMLATSGGQFAISSYYLIRIHRPESNTNTNNIFEYLRMGLNQAPIIYITAFSIHIPILIISSISLPEAGLYSVAAASVLIIGKIPRLLHGMTIGGIVFRGEEVYNDFLKLQGIMLLMIVAFHLLASFLIGAMYGAPFLPAVPVSIILAYSMIPLLFISLSEAKFIVFEKYNLLIAYKLVACSVLILELFMINYLGLEINAISVAWCVFIFRYISALLIFLTVRFQSIKVFS